MPAPKLTLAKAIQAVPPPADGLLLTVSAEKVMLPSGADAPARDASLADVAAAFGGITREFGSVTALAPASMTLLNTQPDPPNILADMNPPAAMHLLAASLDDAQWQALTSAQGLGLADLTDDTQRGLFLALFQDHRLWVGSEDPALKSLPPEQRGDVRDATNQIEATRIRLGQAAKIRLHDMLGKTISFSADRPDAAQRLHTWRPKPQPSLTRYGATLKAAVPNALKPSDLDWDTRALQVPVPLAGLKTVGDLVSRIAQKSSLELYADPRYAARTLTSRGTMPAAPAADLLRALCLCVTATFRRVGPAYVLTDDLTGVGVRRTQISVWEDAGAAARDALEEQAGSAMMHRRLASARTLPAFGDTLAVTPEQMALIPDDPLIPGLPKSFDDPFPFSKLTPAQQSWMRQTSMAYNEKLHTGAFPPENGRTDADLSHEVDLQVSYQIQFLVPTVSRPVDTTLNFPLSMLYYPGSAELSALADAQAAAGQEKAAAMLPPAPPLSALLRLGQCRAVLARPHSAAEVDALIAAMQALGLNQLWLDVFSEGVNRVKASEIHGPDIVTEATNKTRGTGIAVYADLSLLAWGDDPPQSVRDLTITGLDSRAEAIRADTSSADAGTLIPFTPPAVQASPSSRAVQQMLLALVQTLAARPGLAGFVWEDAKAGDNLGYTPEMRLAFLRAVHADPLDFAPGISPKADTALPLFDDPAADGRLQDGWARANRWVNTALLGRLREAARRGDGAALPVLMAQELDQKHWFASWDDLKETLPLRDLTLSQDAGPAVPVLKSTRTQGSVVLPRETLGYDGDTAALARKLQDDARSLPGSGFVLDFSGSEAAAGTPTLDLLTRAVLRENAVK